MEDVNYARSLELLWKADEEFQMVALHGIVKNIRQVHDPKIEQLQVDYLRKIGAFYVPNNLYMAKSFGAEVMDIKRSIYNAYQQCYLLERLAIPLRLLNDQVIGFVGYSNAPADWPDTQAWVKYRYPDARAFKKSRFMFIESDEYRKALTEGYICIVDGLFDKMILQALGVNAVSLCGSNLTEWHRRYLSFIPHIVVIGDNDHAGRLLYYSCRKWLPNTVEIKQPFCGDIDDYLKSRERIAILMDTINDMKCEGFLASKVIRGEPRKSYGRTNFFREEIADIPQGD